MTRLLLVLTVGWWLGIGAIVIEHNLAPLGHSSLNWHNPTRTTAHFAWHERPTVEDGHVIIPPGQTRKFTVTLPRGFAAGELTADYLAGSEPTTINLTAESRPGKTVRSQATDSPAVLKFAWGELAARGRRFDFSISSSGTAASTVIKKFHVIAQR